MNKLLLPTVFLAFLGQPLLAFTVEISITAPDKSTASALYKQTAATIASHGWSASQSPDRTSDIYLGLACSQIQDDWVVVTRSMRPVSGRAIGADAMVELRDALQRKHLLTHEISHAIEEDAQSVTATDETRYYSDPTVAIYSARDLSEAVAFALTGWVHDQGDYLPMEQISSWSKDSINYYAANWNIALPSSWTLSPRQYPWKAIWLSNDGLHLNIGEKPIENDRENANPAKAFAMDTYQEMALRRSVTPYRLQPSPKGYADWVIVPVETVEKNGIRTYFMAFSAHDKMVVRIFLWADTPRSDLGRTVLPVLLRSFSWKTNVPTTPLIETDLPKPKSSVLDNLLPDLSPSGVTRAKP